MGQQDALRGGVYWLVEPLDGKRLPRLVQSTHHLGAEALAKNGSEIRGDLRKGNVALKSG